MEKVNANEQTLAVRAARASWNSLGGAIVGFPKEKSRTSLPWTFLRLFPSSKRLRIRDGLEASSKATFVKIFEAVAK